MNRQEQEKYEELLVTRGKSMAESYKHVCDIYDSLYMEILGI